jgi:hypothetical protein
MKLYDNEMAERMSISENGYMADNENEDTGFSNYDEAVNFAATMTAEKGGAYAVVEIKDMFCQTPSDEKLCRDYATPISRIQYDGGDEPILSVGVAEDRKGR